MDEQYKDIFAEAKLISEWDTEVSITPIEKVAYDNLIMIGDASSQSTPLMMEGVRPGMHQGIIAAQVAKKSILLKDYSYKTLKEYEDKSINEPKFSENQQLAKIFQLMFIEFNDEEFEIFFSEINKLDKKILLRVLRSELTISDMPSIYKLIHKIVPIHKLFLNLSDSDRHEFIKRIKIYIKDEIIELINKL